MRKFAYLLALSILAVPTLCQEVPRVEVFGGYSLTHDKAQTRSGWNAQATLNLNRWLGITTDVAGHYGNTHIDLGLSTINYTDSLHTFTVGPTLSYRTSKFTPFAHVLIGGARSGGTSTVSYPSFPSVPSYRLSGSDHAFAMLTGGGIDVNLTRRIAFRPVQADWLLTRFGGINWNRFRYSAGIVIRF